MLKDTKIYITIKDDISGEVYLEKTALSVDDAIAALGTFERHNPEICQSEDVKEF